MPFHRFLTVSIALLLALSILFFIGEVLDVAFSFQVDDYWVKIIFAILFFLGLHYALLMGFSSNYFLQKQSKSEIKGQGHLIDTSAIIDGRLIEIAKSGFSPKDLIIPQFVVRELQLISDSPDHEKRTKGRRGLDMLKQMKNSNLISVTISEEDASDVGVDNKLLALARLKKYNIITTDFNLIKVGQVEGLGVLNINMLATLLKPSLAIGDKIKVFISKKGNNRNQGVAFLPDDTMVVIEDAEKFIGYQRFVMISSYIQNESGRIAFARVVNNNR